MNFKRIFVLILGLVLVWSTICFSEVLNQYTVTANTTGDGVGNVSSNVGGINYNYHANNTGTTARFSRALS